MKNNNFQQTLWDDVFEADDGPSLHSVRRLARRRRWIRRGRLAALVVLLVAIPSLFLREPRRLTAPELASDSGKIWISSAPLREGQVVRTSRSPVPIVRSTGALQLAVRNPNALILELVDDEHLLEIVPGALLVHQARGAELVLPPTITVWP